MKEKELLELRNRIFRIYRKIDSIKDKKKREILISEFNSMISDIPLFPKHDISNLMSFRPYTNLQMEESKKEASKPLYLKRS